MITGQQIREARSLLGWARWRLARHVYLSVKNIADMEGSDTVPDVSTLRLCKIKSTLESAGIQFDPPSEVKAGVQMQAVDTLTPRPHSVLRQGTRSRVADPARVSGSQPRSVRSETEL